MKIRSIVAGGEDLQLTRPYSISYKTVTHVENVVVKVELENGITGVGTANPSKYVVGRDISDTLTALNEAALQPFTGKDIRTFYSLLKMVHDRFSDQAGAAAALDIALHDAFTQWLGVPLVSFLGQSINTLPTSITIGIKNVEDTIAEAREYFGRGFRVLKVKLGGGAGTDVERLVKLREVFGDKVVIRVDANQDYSPEQFRQFCQQTGSLDLELIEQPMPAHAVDEMRQLPSEIRRLVAADESLVGPRDAFRLASPPAACGIFNIKLMKCGGVQPALRIAAIAEQAGIELMWGCNDESIVSISAALHAAFSSPSTRYLDLDGSLDLARDIVEGGFVLKDGYMTLTDRPGLGVRLL
ncbi:dipeptide epimerase [Paraflavitalea sp. CAU 1676]|uniref:mandelate racemase/muconate lactonizing enzyme family protein n=1 Tax=Paraflavitalea sp. CAU 1676 TaxID=3032598 RepID=UPI0023DAF8B9|nr:dipeptide epimerase [Paraflavitalea sp. CAU 1676]MDF2189764.1 dipeptide epimerase [Paraflavitalea sp. CAU 1676]